MAAIVNGVYPRNIIAGQSTKAYVTGTNFLAPLTIILGGNTIAPTLVAQKMVQFIIPSLPSGTYTLVVKNSDGTKTCFPNAVTVTDNQTLNSKLGSAAQPLVLPPIVINSKPTAVVNNNVTNMQYSTGSSIVVSGNTLTATKSANTAYGEQEPFTSQKTAPISSLINSPFGTFQDKV